MTQQLLSMLGGAPRRRRLAAFAALAMASAIAGSLLHGCGSSPPKRARAVTPELAIRDMPNILRGTVGAEATLRGLNPTLVTGYGIVVGLNGTGSSDIPVAVRAMLEQEMARRGVGSESQGLGWTTPTRMLNDPNTAVVLVRAAIPPGSPVGTRFDVLVTALPGTSTTSLEGGRLWSTDLRRGNQAPGGPDVPAIATATGDVFINPFADPAGDDTAGVSRTTGRILNGGVVSEALELALILDNPSHARSRSIVAAINSRFPQGRGDRDPVARGVNEEVVLLTVPNRFRSDTETFLELVLASRVDVSAGQEWARRYTMAMKSEPELSEDLAWRLRALGDVSVPFLRDLYAYPEILPRIQALRAGAGLGDPLVTPHLMDLARDGAPALRTEAIELLAGMGPDPQINTALRKMLDDDNLGVRIAAYEALASRADPLLERTNIEGKFLLDEAPAQDPMIYVSQSGLPKIVVFGAGLSIGRPTLVTGWSDRLMLTADAPTDPLRVYYLDHRTQQATQAEVNAELSEFIEFLAHEQTPEQPSPGLNLTYSEVVGALHEIWKEDGFKAGFVAEQDRLAAELINSVREIMVAERPELLPEDEEEAEETGIFDAAPTPSLPGQRPELSPETPAAASDEDSEATDEEEPKKRRYVVPLRKSEPPK